MYRNYSRLTCYNRNCIIPIRLGMPVYRINNNRPILIESRHNFHFLPRFITKTTGPIFTNFFIHLEELVDTLMCTYIKQYCIPFQNARTKREGGKRSWIKCVKIIEAGCTNSYITNSRACWNLPITYRNDHWLTSWLQNYDIPLYFGM